MTTMRIYQNGQLVQTVDDGIDEPLPPNSAATQRIDAVGACWWEWLDADGVLITQPCEEV
jgi:hypothetical protein